MGFTLLDATFAVQALLAGPAPFIALYDPSFPLKMMNWEFPSGQEHKTALVGYAVCQPVLFVNKRQPGH